MVDRRLDFRKKTYHDLDHLPRFLKTEHPHRNFPGSVVLPALVLIASKQMPSMPVDRTNKISIIFQSWQ
jgi:hypothetical protein